MEKDGAGLVRLRNTHTNKYLRIMRNNDVNVDGGLGQLTLFRYHVHTHPNGVRLESCRFPGKYIAIRPNGAVMHGAGGVHTRLFFFREGQPQPQQKVIYVQQPAQPVQPTVIVSPQPVQPVQPQVIVTSPSYQAQQQMNQQQQQIAQQQQQMAAQKGGIYTLFVCIEYNIFLYRIHI